MSQDGTKSEWEQATGAVFRAIHAQLRSKEKRPVLGSSESAVWLTWHLSGEAPLRFQIDAPEWWKPLTDAHAAELAARLLDGLREELRRHEASRRAGS